MARSTFNHPSKRQRQPRRQQFEEQRPVLQLPLVRPEWRAPEREEPSERERGVVVVDFYI